MIDIPLLPADVALAMARQCLCDVYPPVTISLAEQMVEHLATVRSPLHLQLAASSMALRLVHGAFSKDSLRSSIYDQADHLLDLVAEIVGRKVLAYSMLFLANARHGLSDVEISDLLLFVTDLDLPYCCSRKCRTDVSPQLLWVFIKMVLKPYLTRRPVSGVPLYHFKHVMFHEVISAMFKDLRSGALQAMREYFEQKNSNLDSDKKEAMAKQCLFKEQKLRFNRRVNRRRLDEHPWLLLQQDALEEMQNCYLKDVDMLFTKMEACGVYQVVQDIQALSERQKNSTDVYIQGLLELICDHVAVLSRDSSAFRRLVLQYHNEHTSNEYTDPLDVLYDSAIKQRLNPLKPVQCLDLDSSLPDDAENTIQQTYMSDVFTLAGHVGFLATVAPRKGELVVWNVASQTAVRTLRGLQVSIMLRTGLHRGWETG